MALFASVDWTAGAAFAGVAGTVLVGFFAYMRGRKADESLDLSKRIDSLLGGQQSLIDDLREEAERNRAGWNDCLGRCARLQEQVDGQKSELHELHEVVDILRHKLAQAGLT